VKNATFSILSVGDDRPMEVIEDAVNQERYITYKEMGSFNVRLAAVNGKQLVEQTQVGFSSGKRWHHSDGEIAGELRGGQGAATTRTWRIGLAWPADAKAATARFARSIVANRRDKPSPRRVGQRGRQNAPRKPEARNRSRQERR